VRGGRGGRYKQLLDDRTGTRRYWKFKDVSLDRTLQRTRFGSGYVIDYVLNTCMNDKLRRGDIIKIDLTVR
jgi:hypothetical protein